MCYTYVLVKEVVLQEIVWGKKVAYQRCQFRSVYRSFSAFFFSEIVVVEVVQIIFH